MGKALSVISRPIKNWNIESRAHKAISKEKRPSAPTYDSVEKQIQITNELEPQYREEAQRKNPQLDDNLKKLFIRSTDATEIDSRNNPDRPLPKDNLVHESFEYGFYESPKIPEGKISLRQALEFITKHNQDPKNYTAEVVAKEYKIDPETAANILEYFKIYRTIKSDDSETESYYLPLSLKSGIAVKHSKAQKPSPYGLLEEEELEGVYEEQVKQLEAKIEEEKTHKEMKKKIADK